MTRLRAKVQEEKAVLVLQLHTLCRRPPPELSTASVQATRQWLARLRFARTVKGDPRASVQELLRAIESMQQPVAAGPCGGPEA